MQLQHLAKTQDLEVRIPIWNTKHSWGLWHNLWKKKKISTFSALDHSLSGHYGITKPNSTAPFPIIPAALYTPVPKILWYWKHGGAATPSPPWTLLLKPKPYIIPAKPSAEHFLAYDLWHSHCYNNGNIGCANKTCYREYLQKLTICH